MSGRSIFPHLSGSWTLHRLIVSARPNFPGGTFTGTGTFTARPPTFTFDSTHEPRPVPVDTPNLPTEYLYTETGTFTTTTSLTVTATRSYIYTLSPTTSVIDVWFVNGSGEVDRFFHSVDFDRVPEGGVSVLDAGVDGAGGVKAVGEHLCAEDWYCAGYRFEVRERGGMEKWWVRYKVQGPRKDYVAETEFVRG